MVNSSFHQGNPEDQGVPEEEEIDVSPLDADGGGRGSSRRILIIAGIGIVLIGGWYLANQLFLAPSPSPPAPSRPAIPGPQPAETAAPPSAAPTLPPSKEEAKRAVPTPPTKASGSTAPPQEAAPEKAGVTKGAAGEALGMAEPGKAAAPAQVEAKTTAKPGLTTPPRFSLQMGAMVMEENADVLKRKLDANGFPAVVRKGTAFITKQLVTVGDPTSRSEAEELSRRLGVDGFPSELLTIGGKYTPQIGAFFNLDEAIDLARELQKKNYHPKITSKPANTVVYQVRHGQFDSRSAAVKRGGELKNKGFNSLVVRD